VCILSRPVTSLPIESHPNLTDSLCLDQIARRTNLYKADMRSPPSLRSFSKGSILVRGLCLH